jgi:hypothetical protein
MPLTPTVRGTPTGKKIENGFRIKITFASNATVNFWERAVKPPGFDGGDPTDTTTQFNTTVRTKGSRKLITITDITGTVLYDPAVIPQILALINVEQAVTVLWPDGATLALYGYLKNFEPAEMGHGRHHRGGHQLGPDHPR